MKVFYLSEPYWWTHTAGSKPRNDFQQLYRSLGYTDLYNTIDEKISITADDVVIFQYSFANDYDQQVYLNALKIGAKTVLVVLDIISKQQGYEEKELQKEIKFFNTFNCLIVHNDRMKIWLEKQGVITKMVSLELFDYLVEKESRDNIPHRKLCNEVVFAGNLDPRMRKFIYDKENNFNFILNLYGPFFDKSRKIPQVNYFGSYNPDTIPYELTGSFGLIWNGIEENHANPLTEYTKLISSHKLSLYIVANLPIICWSKSADADFVLKNKIGFVVDSLDEIDKKINQMTYFQYKEMISNIESISDNVARGDNTLTTLNQAIDKIFNS